MKYEKIELVNGTTIVDKELLDHFQDGIINSESNWFGKKYVAYGDSITKGTYYNHYSETPGFEVAEKPYPMIIGEILGCDVINNGYNGSCVGPREGDTINNNLLYRLRNTNNYITNDIDLITIAFGTNDFGNNIPLGEEDSSDENTFYGAYESVAKILCDTCPLATIVLISPIQRASDNTNTLGNKLQDYRDAIEYICNKYGFCYIDGRQLGMNSRSSSWYNKYIKDGLHPYPDAHKKLGTTLAHKINAL